MKKDIYYRVARHLFLVKFVDDINDEKLIDSCETFRLPADYMPAEGEATVFTLTVNQNWHPTKKGSEIGQYDCGGYNHGVYQLEDGSYQIVISDEEGHHCSLLQATPDFSSGTVLLNGNHSMRAFGLNNSLMMMYAFATADKNTVLMHASVVRKDGLAYLCLGVSGTGKSTHTGNWLKYIEGTDLINDDNPVVRITDDGVVKVYGSPWSGKTPCYRDVEAPVGGFLQLMQAPYNKIRRQTPIEAFASLLPSCSVMKWDARDYSGTCDTVVAIIERVPTYFMENLPNEDAVRMSFETMHLKKECQ